MTARPERSGSGGAGSCNCGGVRYRVNGPMREVVACHCSQCRKQSGHFYAATDCADADFEMVSDATLKWYAASDAAKRGFCGECGSALFWKRNNSDKISIMAGTLDDEGGVKLDRHIFCADKGSYYDIEDGKPQFDQGD